MRLDVSVDKPYNVCPHCGSYRNKISDTRNSSDGSTRIRTRLCLDCNEKWRTAEVNVEEINYLKTGYKDLYGQETKNKIIDTLKAVDTVKGQVSTLHNQVNELNNTLSDLKDVL